MRHLWWMWLAALSVAAAACTGSTTSTPSQTAEPAGPSPTAATSVPTVRSPQTTTPQAPATTGTPAEPTANAPADTFLLPSGATLTIWPDPITEFAPFTTCSPDDEHVEVTTMQAFVHAYNHRLLDEALAVFQPDDIWDVSAIPHTSESVLHDPQQYLEAGWAVNDHLDLVSLIPYGPFAGADVALRRSNDVLRAVGIDDVVEWYKVRMDPCVIERFVGGGLDLDGENRCLFFDTFAAVLAPQEIGVPSDCG